MEILYGKIPQQKKQKNVRVATQAIPEGEMTSYNYPYANSHMVFDIEMEEFCKKACLVAGDHMTHAPDVVT